MYSFFFNDTATTEIYTLSLHDALPISGQARDEDAAHAQAEGGQRDRLADEGPRRHRDAAAQGPDPDPRPPLGQDSDRKSTRLNSSHANISYAVFCLKKKKNT